MKVKIGDKIYDGDKEPVMVVLTDKDKTNIANMEPWATKYAQFPDSFPDEEIKEFMHLPGEEEVPEEPCRTRKVSGCVHEFESDGGTCVHCGQPGGIVL